MAIPFILYSDALLSLWKSITVVFAGQICGPGPLPTQAPPHLSPTPLMWFAESKVLVADPEVLRKCTHEPHGNTMKKKEKKTIWKLRVIIHLQKTLYKAYNMQTKTILKENINWSMILKH